MSHPPTPYDRIAAEWESARRVSLPGEARYFHRLLEALPAGATLLDLGCGTGHPIGTMLAAAGVQLVGVDLSEKLLTYARRRLPEQRWVQADARVFETSERFAAVIAWDSVFFHSGRAEHAGLLQRIHRFLEPGGRLLFTAGGSDGPAFTDVMFGETFAYDSHPPQRTLELVRAAGFSLEEHELLDRPDGQRNRGRLVVLARKTDASRDG